MTDDTTAAIPPGFGFEKEHPMLSLPFSVLLGKQVLQGKRISVTEMEVELPAVGAIATGRQLASVKFPFEDFAISMTVDVTVTPSGSNDTAILLFSDPTGAHLPQLRYVINSFIAGDVVTLKGMMAYTGPTQPKAPKADTPPTVRDRVRSIGIALMSLLIAFLVASVVFGRYTTAYEMHPVFIDRAGQAMQATVAGQLTYLDPDANAGDVAYTIAAVTGDVLSFQMPSDGEVRIASEIYQGKTVLPEDLILTIFDDSQTLRLRTLMSIEGLNRALQGDPARIELDDGRKFAVDIKVSDTTRAAALQGDLFVPVDLAVIGGGLAPSDINKSARLRLSKTLGGLFGFRQENGQ